MEVFFSNPAYATIIAAIIAGAVAIWVAIYNNKKSTNKSNTRGSKIKIENLDKTEITNTQAKGNVSIKDVKNSKIEGGNFDGR